MLQQDTDKMSTNAIVSVRNVDISRISFVVGQAKNGRNPSVNIKYDGQNVGFRLPRLHFPGGLMDRVDEKTGAISYTLMGTLRGCDPYGKERANPSDDIGAFYNFLLDLNDKIVQSAVENSVKWFGKKRSEEAIRDGFKSLMRISADKVDGEYQPNGKYPPSVTLKVPVYDNRVNVDVVDPRGNPLYVVPSGLKTSFAKGCEANLAVSASIYIMAGGGFGVTWRITHAQMFPKERITAAAVFSDSIQEEDDVQESEEVEESTPVVVTGPALEVEIPDTYDESAAPAPPAPQKTERKRRAVPAP
jgi:hypothetical protein